MPPRSKSNASDPGALAWARAVRLLAARDRSEHEVRLRLQATGATEAAIDSTLQRARAYGYLDDTRCARGVAAAGVRRGVGSLRVRADLEAKGIAAAVIDRVVASAFAEEVRLAEAVLARRFPSFATSPVARAKAARFLLQRGFPEHVVLAILGEGC